MHAQRRSTRKAMRHLARLAHERELRGHLEVLHERFHDCLAGQIDSFAMSDLVHEFCAGPSRDLYRIYDQLERRMQVARAVSRDLLIGDEVPHEVRVECAGVIEFFADQVRREDDARAT